MTTNENSARRLLIIVEKAISIPNHTTAISGWNAVLGGGEGSETIARFAIAMKLPEQVENDYIRIGADPDICKYATQQCAQAFKQLNFRTNWEPVLKCFDQHTAHYLRSACMILDAAGYDKEIEEQHIIEIRELISNFIAAIADSDIDPILTEHINESMANLLRDVNRYAISGMGPAIAAWQSTIGLMSTSNSTELKEFVAVDTKEKGAFWKLFHQMSSVTTVLSSGPKLLSEAVEVIKLLL